MMDKLAVAVTSLFRWTVQLMIMGKILGNSIIRVGLLLLIAQCSTSLAAQGLQSEDYSLVNERPNPSGEATLITVTLYIFDIDEIDDVNQRFSIDLFFVASWSDSRLALPEAERREQIRTFSMDNIWTPRALIVNDRGLSNQLPRIASVDDLGNVTARQRVSGDLAVSLELKDFPFDTQRLQIDVVSYQYSPDEVQFAVNADVSADAGSFSAAGWKLKIIEPDFEDFTVPAAGMSRARLAYLIEAQRNSQYFLLTMFLPMSLIVFMSWTVFWLQPDIVPARIGISTASIFSLLALGFSIRLSLPAVSYMTRADLFVIGCTLLVFVALAVAVIGSRWASSNRMEQALRLNAIARWVYAGLFSLVAIVAVSM
jgi:hypothetical protein